MRSGVEILDALDMALEGVQKGSSRLSRLLTEFGESHYEGNVLRNGTKIEYGIALQDELTRIYEEAVANGTRVPAEDVRAALAERAVRTKNPELYSRFQQQKTDIEAMKIWLSNQRQVISGYQSLRNAER